MENLRYLKSVVSAINELILFQQFGEQQSGHSRNTQTLNVVYDCHVGVIGKTSTLPKHGDIILNSMIQTREKWDSLVLSRADF